MPRIKIRDMEVGQTYECPMAVINSTPRTTRAGKPYLVMELFDGFDSITCNYWDWKGENTPARNTVYDFKVECSEYAGKKQLTCRKVTTNSTDMLEDFMPQGAYDVSQAYKDAFSLIENLSDDFYREIGLHIFEEARGLWLHVPGAKSIHHNYMGGTLIHSLSVANLAKAMAENTLGAWVDLATIGGLLHDVGKLFTYDLDGLAIEYTDDGQMLDHVFIGAEFVGNQSEAFIKDDFDELKLQMLRHVILSHHMLKEYGSPVTPKCIEAWIVAHADGLDAQCENIREESRKVGQQRWTEKIWALNNVPHFTVQGMDALSKKQHTIGYYDCIFPPAEEQE